jgi:site-specific recombinase XerD
LEGVVFMCYKDEVQKSVAEKLELELKEVPLFIKNFFISKPKLKSKQSQFQYWNTFKNFLGYMISNNVISKDSILQIIESDINQIKKTNVDQYLIYCRDTLNNSDTTIKTKYNALCSLFSYFYDDEIISRNIMNKVAIDEPKHKPIKYATIEDKKELIHNLNNIKNEYDRIRDISIVELLMGSGIRILELVGLDMEDLFLQEENPYIIVRRKGGDTDKVFLTIDAKISIQEYLEIRDERVDESNKHILFLSENEDEFNSKTRMKEDAVRKFIKKYSNGKLTPHMFRKGLGMLIVNSENGNYDIAAQQLGHGSTVTTKRWYATINEDKMTKVLNSL